MDVYNRNIVLKREFELFSFFTFLVNIFWQNGLFFYHHVWQHTFCLVRLEKISTIMPKILEKRKNISFFREFEFQAPDSSLPKARRAIFNETYQMILLLILAIFIEFWKLSINVHSYSREPFRNLLNSINLIS